MSAKKLALSVPLCVITGWFLSVSPLHSQNLTPRDVQLNTRLEAQVGDGPPVNTPPSHVQVPARQSSALPVFRQSTLTGAIGPVSRSLNWVGFPDAVATASLGTSRGIFGTDAVELTLDHTVAVTGGQKLVEMPCTALICIPSPLLIKTYGQALAQTNGIISAILDPLPHGNRYRVALKFEALDAGGTGFIAAAILRNVNTATDLAMLTVPGERFVEVNSGTLISLNQSQIQAARMEGAGASFTDRARYRSNLRIVSPFIGTISPAEVPVAGRNVTIDGLRFNAGTGLRVTIGGRNAAIIGIPSSTRIVAAVPPDLAAPGSFVDVRVEHSNGAFTVPRAIEIEASTLAPTFAGIDPTSDRAAGGKTFTIVGGNFNSAAGATEVFFDGVKAAGNATSSGIFKGTVPPGEIGFATIRIATAAGTRNARDAFYYEGNPILSGFSPPHGPNQGGTRVIISGLGLKDATDVAFGGVRGANLSVIDDTQVAVETPRLLGEPSREVQVEVMTRHGRTAFAQPFCYFSAGEPGFAGIAPAIGPSSGGSTILISGSHFAVCDTSIQIGGVPVPGAAINSTTFQGTLPPGEIGFADVSIRTPMGIIHQPNAFYYAGSPLIDGGVEPTGGSTAGGTVVTLVGRGLKDITSVTFGGIAGVIDIASISDSEVRVTTPAWPDSPGPVDIVISTLHGETTLPGGYLFQIFGSFFISKATAALKRSGWSVRIAEASFDPGPDPYLGDGEEIRLDLEGTEFFGPESVLKTKLKFDKKTGAVAMISMVDRSGNKLLIDLAKNRLAAKLKNVPVKNFMPDDGVGIGIEFGDFQGELIAPADIVGNKQNKVLLQPTGAELLPLP